MKIIDIIQLIDLTTLNEPANWQDVVALHQLAHSEGVLVDNQTVAALCIWPQFVAALAELKQSSPYKIATVINFPNGQSDVESCQRQMEQAITSGADEIDLVIPYQDVLRGELVSTANLVECGAEVCAGQTQLKVIIESGCLHTEKHIKTVSEICIENGTDFLKTSTGKVPVNATLDAARYMLETIKSSGLDIGFKASGGISTMAQALTYIDLAKSLMGKTWVVPENFRFGASSLLRNLIAEDTASAIAPISTRQNEY